ncbi:hypothetical protein Tco_1491736 [Tanacetum coccineum]
MKATMAWRCRACDGFMERLLSELTYPYEEVDSLNPPPPAFESKPDDEIEVENPIEHEDETVPVSVYEVELGNEVRSSVDPRILACMERLVVEARIVLCREVNRIMPPKSAPMTQAAMRRMIKESVDAAIAVDQERQAKVSEGQSTVFCGIEGAIELQRWFEKTESVFGISECAKGKKVRIMPPKSAPITQAAMQRMIKESVDAAITVERERQVKVRNDASGSGPVRGQNTAPVVRECTFARFMKCNPTVFCGIEGAIELQRWFEKTESVFGISECAKGKKVRFVAATLKGPALT